VSAEHRDEGEATTSPEETPQSEVAPSDDAAQGLGEAREQLENHLEAARKEAAEIKERWLRAAADLENYRKRAGKEREELQKYGNEKLLRDFLPVYDDLQRALNAVDTTDNDAASQLQQGVDLVRKKFLQQLERHGVASFDSTGEAFDPARHDAIQQAHSNEVEAGRILEELQRGFMLNDRLLRPAMVVVSLGPAESSE